MDTYFPPQDTHSESAFYACVKGAAEYYQVPAMALLAIYRQEHGQSGGMSMNSDGTADYGRFQINGIWEEHLHAHHIRLEQVKKDNCLNAYVGANIFKNRYASCKGNVWCAIGLYHSGNEPYRSRYVSLVYKKYQVLERDRIFLNWYRSLPIYHASQGRWEFLGEQKHAAAEQ
jgi:Transglycosylase SLT domain